MRALTSLDAATVEKLVSAAVSAPSIHNTQPWCFGRDPRTDTVFVRAATQRRLPYIDPAKRALHISLGAAVFNLRVAARHLDWQTRVKWLPQPDDPDLVARVQLDHHAPEARPRRPDLYEAVWHRHTSRFPFTGREIPLPVLAELAEAAPAEGATLLFPDAPETERLLRLTRDAERRNCGTPERRAETSRWVHGPDAGPYGLPTSALGPHDTAARVPMRDFAAPGPQPSPAAMPFEAEPVIAVLSTRGDSRVDWLRAGEALERVLLLATHHGLCCSLHNQAMEWPDLRWALRDPYQGPHHVQMLVRLGYGTTRPETPRMAAHEALDQGGEDGQS